MSGISGEYILINKEKMYVKIFNSPNKHLLGISGLQGSAGRGGQFGNTAIKTYYYWQCNWAGGINFTWVCLYSSIDCNRFLQRI